MKTLKLDFINARSYIKGLGHSGTSILSSHQTLKLDFINARSYIVGLRMPQYVYDLYR
jgi:hypothetical protein